MRLLWKGNKTLIFFRKRYSNGNTMLSAIKQLSTEKLCSIEI